MNKYIQAFNDMMDKETWMSQLEELRVTARDLERAREGAIKRITNIKKYEG